METEFPRPHNKTVHVVFSSSDEEILRAALAELGLTETVVSNPDALNRGPINDATLAERNSWLENVVGGEWPVSPDEAQTFWIEALRTDVTLVAWMTKRSSHTYAGFLEWVWHLKTTPCLFADLTEVHVRSQPAFLYLLEPSDVISNDLLGMAKPMTPDLRSEFQNAWDLLRLENSPLRIVRGGELVSAPIDVFDRQIMSHVDLQWQRAARVVGATLADAFDDWVFQAGDEILISRIAALIQAGNLECRPLAEPGQSKGSWALEVRAAPSAAV